jgi:protein-tyrosine phosphatase
VTATAGERVLTAPGTFNLRDVGGYPAQGGTIRWGVLFRSGGLQRLDDEGRAALLALGLRTVLDLREEAERVSGPDAVTGTGLAEVHVPVYQGATSHVATLPALPTLEQLYLLMLEDCAAGLVAAVRELARPGALPGLVHCAAGKDRTGLVVALVLSALGVPDDVVAEDYGLTSRHLPAEFLAVTTVPDDDVDPERAALLRAIYQQSPPPVMRAVLDALRIRHGGARGYLLTAGLAAAELDQLRAALVTDH